MSSFTHSIAKISEHNPETYAIYCIFYACSKLPIQNFVKSEHIARMKSPLSTSTIPARSPPIELKTVEIYRASASVNRNLAELKGRAEVIINQVILIDTLSLQEAKASLKIETSFQPKMIYFAPTYQVEIRLRAESKK
jgi:hypothetical protein